tara:strand:- start:75 stop:560 length:486 start_codon:yes stop_codon:yes gene_type:complete
MIYNLLEPKGLVNISTKSKIAYQNVSKALELASKEINIDEKDDKTLKELRSLVRKSNNNIIKYLGILPQFNNRNDLYHLLFPISKSFLDIPKLSELIKKNKFKFIGWGRFVPQEIKKTIYHQYKKEYPEDENYKNLENWNSFEKRHPSIFVNDYDFWLEKS